MVRNVVCLELTYRMVAIRGVVVQGGYFVPEENPREFLDAVLPFLAG